MENEIKLVQSPVIKHKLKEAGALVAKRISDLDLDKQVATALTVKSLKSTRTELNKELSDFETQRKAIKKAVNTPYDDFEEIYKTEISEKYSSAISLLKDKIAFVEDEIKSNKKDAVESYFNELCVAEKIDFIDFDKVGVVINLTITEKKCKEQVYAYIEKVSDDLKLIKSTDFEAEILTEYKSSLNVANAITVVKARKEKEAQEKARIKANQIQNRKNYVENLGMNFVEITNAYEFNEDIYITISDIEDLSKEDFTAKYSECEAKIKDIKSKEAEAVKRAEKLAEQNAVPAESPIIEKPIIKEVVREPISAPVIEKKVEPLKTASFEVTATMPQLRALGAYMKENNITYKNI